MVIRLVVDADMVVLVAVMCHNHVKVVIRRAHLAWCEGVMDKSGYEGVPMKTEGANKSIFFVCEN